MSDRLVYEHGDFKTDSYSPLRKSGTFSMGAGENMTNTLQVPVLNRIWFSIETSAWKLRHWQTEGVDLVNLHAFNSLGDIRGNINYKRARLSSEQHKLHYACR